MRALPPRHPRRPGLVVALAVPLGLAILALFLLVGGHGSPTSTAIGADGLRWRLGGAILEVDRLDRAPAAVRRALAAGPVRATCLGVTPKGASSVPIRSSGTTPGLGERTTLRIGLAHPVDDPRVCVLEPRADGTDIATATFDGRRG